MLEATDEAAGAGLRRRDWELLHRILETEDGVERVRLFGSRAQGTQLEHSDIDLVLEGADVDLHTLLRLKGEFEESNLPVSVDVVRLTPETEERFAANVRRWSKLVFARLPAETPAVSTLRG